MGSIFDGKVTGITKFGAFVSLPENRTGMVHISEVSHTYVSDITEHLSEGQEVKVKIIGIDDNGRINLSIKQASPPPQRNNTFRRENTRKASPPKEETPLTFEDRLRQFMQDSESRMSDLKQNTEKRRGSRRGRK